MYLTIWVASLPHIITQLMSCHNFIFNLKQWDSNIQSLDSLIVGPMNTAHQLSNVKQLRSEFQREVWANLVPPVNSRGGKSPNYLTLWNSNICPPYFLWWWSMSGKNRRLVADEPVEVQDFSKFTDHFGGIYRIYLKWIKQKWKMSTCNRLDLESLGSWPTLYVQKLPGHWWWCVL